MNIKFSKVKHKENQYVLIQINKLTILLKLIIFKIQDPFLAKIKNKKDHDTSKAQVDHLSKLNSIISNILICLVTDELLFLKFISILQVDFISNLISIIINYLNLSIETLSNAYNILFS